jgi:hypothetical protein
MRSAAILLLLLLGGWTHGTSGTPPTAAVVCDAATGIATGVGAGTCMTTPAVCDGVTNVNPAFTSFNNWAVNTWQASHTGLIQLNLPAGTCLFNQPGIGNFINRGIKNVQLVGYGTTLSDNLGTGNGFFLGASGLNNTNTIAARIATISAGATSITLLDTSKCSLFTADDWVTLGGIDPQGEGYPPNPQFYEFIQIGSVTSCNATGAIALATPSRYGYKSTWPSYNTGGSGESDQGGPGTVYAMDQRWNASFAFYGLTFDQRAAQIDSNGRTVAFYDLTVPAANQFCPIPSQNQTWSITRGTATSCVIEVDKIVENVTMTNVTIRRLLFQSGSNPQNFTCNNSTFSLAVTGSAGNSTYNNCSVADLKLGVGSFGIAGSFTANNTYIGALTRGGSSQNKIEARGVWSAAGLTVPANLRISSAANNGSGAIRVTVASTAGWTTGIIGSGVDGTNCEGTFPVTVIDGTHADLQGSTFTGTCAGQFGSLPLPWAVPGGYVYFSPQVGASIAPLGPILQVADLAVGANNATVVSFNQNGSPYAGGVPTIPGSSWSLTTHPAPSWTCLGCTGPQDILDITGAAMAGLPFGSKAIRIVTAANSSDLSPYMPVFGALTSAVFNVTATCGGASNFGFDPFISILGSSSVPTWAPTLNATITGLRTITPTSASGAQSGDSLSTPGTGAFLALGQVGGFYSTVGNCGSASTTVTVTTDQGVTFP